MDYEILPMPGVVLTPDVVRIADDLARTLGRPSGSPEEYKDISIDEKKRYVDLVTYQRRLDEQVTNRAKKCPMCELTITTIHRNNPSAKPPTRNSQSTRYELFCADVLDVHFFCFF